MKSDLEKMVKMLEKSQKDRATAKWNEEKLERLMRIEEFQRRTGETYITGFELCCFGNGNPCTYEEQARLRKSSQEYTILYDSKPWYKKMFMSNPHDEGGY